MKKVTIGEPATILKGKLAGHKGNVIGVFTIEDQVEIEVDDYTTVIMSSGNIEQ